MNSDRPRLDNFLVTVTILALAVLSANITVRVADLGRASATPPAFTSVPPLPGNLRFVVIVTGDTRFGSGFVWRAAAGRTYVVTAAHCVSPPDGVLRVGGLIASVERIDEIRDVALVSFAAPWVPDGTYAHFRAPEWEESCRAAGYAPDGMGKASGRVHRGTVCNPTMEGYVCFDGGGRPGMSGGPLVAEDGAVIGMLTHATVAWGFPNLTEMAFLPASVIEAFLDPEKE